MAEHPLQRLTLKATSHERLEPDYVGGWRSVVEPAQQGRRVGATHLFEEPSGVNRVAELLGGRSPELAPGSSGAFSSLAHPATSWRPRSFASRASTSSSRSPMRMRSSFFKVSPMRWSVTRLSLKL